MGKLFWFMVAIALGVYLLMVLWSLPFISNEAGGLMPFDMRFSGYSAEEARAFLGTISDRGRASYLGIQSLLDLIYPGTMGVVLFWALLRLFANVPKVLRIALALTALIGAGFDYLENMRVAGLLRAAIADVSDADIAAASQATVLKSGFDTVAMGAVLIGLVLLWLRRRKDRQYEIYGSD